MTEPRLYLRADTIRRVLERHHCPMGVAGEHLLLSRSHWSRLAHGKVPVSRAVRWRILRSPIFVDVPEADLWERR